MNWIEAIFLAIIEGLTEFLPVSSTGHLILASSFMGIASQPFTKTFTVAIQLGAILSVVVLYWKRFFESFAIYSKLFVAIIPTGIIVLLTGKYVDRVLDRIDVVGFALLLGGILLVFVDNWFADNEKNGDGEVNYRLAFVIGSFQCLAVMLPGLSRSAATIIGGLTQKLNRKTAAEFSFLLAVPTMFAATCYKIFEFYQQGHSFSGTDLSNLWIGNIGAFVVAWLAIRFFINYLSRNGFKVFGYYRIAIGVIILALYYSGFEFSLV